MALKYHRSGKIFPFDRFLKISCCHFVDFVEIFFKPDSINVLFKRCLAVGVMLLMDDTRSRCVMSQSCGLRGPASVPSTLGRATVWRRGSPSTSTPGSARCSTTAAVEATTTTSSSGGSAWSSVWRSEGVGKMEKSAVTSPEVQSPPESSGWKAQCVIFGFTYDFYIGEAQYTAHK